MAAAPARRSALPTPFYDDPWKPAEREAAQALWAWHTALWQADPPDGQMDSFFRDEAREAEAARPLRSIPEPACSAAYRACTHHQLPLELLAAQVRARRLLSPPVRFDAFAGLRALIHRWAVPHARLLARLAGADRNWQRPHIEALAEAFFLVRTLTELPADLAEGRLFIPVQDCARAGVTDDQLRRGRVDERVKKLLWKQSVRARDAFAQSLPLADDLERRYKGAFKRWWLGGLEALNEVERRGFDVWTSPVTLKPRHRLLVRFQARFGRTTFRK